MSFGQDYRFNAQAQNGKVQIFWDQAAAANKPKKKFSYKKKAQPFPLRNVDHPEEPGTEIPVIKEAPRKRPPVQKKVETSHVISEKYDNSTNTKLDVKSNGIDSSSVKENKKLTKNPTKVDKQSKSVPNVKNSENEKIKNSERTKNRAVERSRGRGQKEKGISPSTVTLTQTQLNAILETIGKASNGAVDPIRISIDQNKQDIKIEKVDKAKKESPKDNKLATIQSDKDGKPSTENSDTRKGGVFDLLNKSQPPSNDIAPQKSDEQKSGVFALLNKPGGDTNESQGQQGGVYDLLKNTGSPVTVAPTSVPGLDLGNETKTTDNGAQAADDSKIINANSTQESSPSVPKARMTKGELKRLQWEREKAENDKVSRQVNTLNSVVDNTNNAQKSAAGPLLSKTELKRLQWEREKAENDKVLKQVQTAVVNAAPGVGAVDNTPSVQKSVAGPPLSKAGLKQIQWEKERVEQQQRDSEARTSRNYEVNAIVNDNVIVSPRTYPEVKFDGKASLTKAELKRLQWDKEKAELKEVEKTVYDPWGKPGAGAPIRNDSGRVLTDYQSRLLTNEENTDLVLSGYDSDSLSEKDQVLRTSQEKYHTKQTTSPATNAAPVTNTHNGASTYGTKANSSPSQQNVPAAMRSNFSFGGGAHDDGLSTKEIEKRRWLEDLQKQMAEKQLLKEQGKRGTKEDQGTWADRMGGYKPAALPQQPSVVKDDIATISGGGAIVQDNRANSAPNAPNGDIDSSNLHEKLTNLDPVTQKEFEDKRRRHLEHQRAIQEQVEERQRLKREERERKAQEEAEEERKLQTERDLMKLQFELEQEKAKKKEQREEQRIQALKEAMDKAKEDALRDKMEKRIQRLKKAGHDVSHLQATMEEELTPRSKQAAEQSQNVHVAPTHVPGLNLSPRQGQGQPQSVIVEPTSVPGLGQTPRSSRVTQAPVNEPYTENRVLTPTQLRGGGYKAATGPHSPLREFGTQTETVDTVFDFSRMNKNGNREESNVEIEYKGNVKSKPKASGKKVRVVSAEKDSDNRPQKKTTNEKPKWGVKEKKAVKKNSERDPYYEKRQQQREQKKAERIAKMKALQEANAAKLAAARNPKRAKSREAPSEQKGPTPRTISPPVPALRIDQVDHAESRNAVSHRGQSTVATHRGQSTVVSHRDQTPQEIVSNPQVSHRGQLTNRSNQKSTRKSPSPVRTGTRSPPVPAVHNRLQTDTQTITGARVSPRSPPVPTLQNKTGNKTSPRSYNNDYSMSQYTYDTHARTDHQHDSGNTELPTRAESTEFMPFLRSEAVLDPTHADSPVPVSRESSAQERARLAYYQTHEPGNYGKPLENYNDKKYGHAPPQSKDPIINPQLVTDHPTNRQGIILKQLAEMRKGLLQKQREIESCLSPSELTASRVIREDEYYD